MTKILFGALFLYCGVLAILWVFRLTLIYPLDPTPVAPDPERLPDVAVKHLRTADGEDLVIWAAAGRPGKPTVLYFHGNAGNLSHRTDRFRGLLSQGYGLVAMAYRGSAGATGKPTETAISADAALVRAKMSELLGKPPSGPIVYYGESLGSAVAVKLATTTPPDGMILEAPFTSVPDVAAAALPIFPVRLILDQRWNTAQNIPSLKAPLLVLHGTSDSVIPYRLGKKVFELAGSPDKRLVTVDGGTHVDLWSSVDVRRAIVSFLNRL